MKRILIVDDEEQIQELFNHYLNIIGETDLTFSSDGLDAMMKCSIEKYDFIFLDHKMPRLNGLDLLVALRTGEGPNHNTPIIIISGSLPRIDEVPEELLDTQFISKPIDFSRLKELLN